MVVNGFQLTAESVTKYLRNKSTTPSDIIKVANQLIDDELDVYLPNRLTFVLELLTDRLNDNKLPVNYIRSNYKIWELYNKVWRLIIQSNDKDKIDGNKTNFIIIKSTFQSLKFIEIINIALEFANNDIELLKSITTTIKLARSNSLITSSSNLNNEISIKILTSYLKIINSNKDQDIGNDYIVEIVKFYNNLNKNVKISEKFVNNFIGSTIPEILIYLINFQSLELEQLIKQYLTQQQEDSIISNTKLLLSIDSITNDSIIIYYKILFNSIKDSHTSEEILLLIFEKFPLTIEPLLEFISSSSLKSTRRQNLSFEFLKSLFDQNFITNNGDNNNNRLINWKLIKSILELNIELGIEKFEQILIQLNNKSSFVQSKDQNLWIIDIGQQLIQSFIKAREFVNFFKIWINLDLKNWKSKEFLYLISQNIKELSINELNDLLNFIFDTQSSSKFIILNSIIQGFFIVNDIHLLNQSETLFKKVFQISQDDNELWFAKFQLLCLYENILNVEEFDQIINSTSSSSNIYYYFTLFRIREIYEFDIAKLIESFLKLLISKNSNSELWLKLTLNRWFVLINNLFSNEQINEILSSLLSFKNQEFIDEIFANELIFEQSNIIELLIAKLTSNEDLDKFEINLLLKIPIQCFPRRYKASIINKLTNTSKDSIESFNGDLILHILETPTFKSDIESNIKKLFKFVDNSKNYEIFETIWNHHLINHKETSSNEFINDTIIFLQKSLKSKNLTSYHYLTAIIILNSNFQNSFDLSEISSKFINSIEKLLIKNIVNGNELSWILNTLYQLDLSEESYTKLKPCLISIGKETDEISIKSSLYLILTRNSKYDSPDLNVKYYQSLYLILRDLGCDEISQGLDFILKNLKRNEFVQSFEFVLKSFENELDIKSLPEILISYFNNFNKDTKEESISIFIKSLSVLAQNYSKFTPIQLELILTTFKKTLVENSWLINQYSFELILLNLNRFIATNINEEIFELICLNISIILNLYRYRLSNRHHLIISIFIQLLMKLTKELSNSIKSGLNYQRLLTNLCEPVQSKSASTASDLNSINLKNSIAKKNLRKNLPNLLLSYIYIQLNYSLNSKIKELIIPGIFNIFDILSQDELILINSSLDSNPRNYFKSLYEDYKKTGKWKND